MYNNGNYMHDGFFSHDFLGRGHGFNYGGCGSSQDSYAKTKAKDPYEVLGVSRGATKAEIKAAYRRLALRHHPDRVRNDSPNAEEEKKRANAKFAEISAAYEVLTSGKDGGAAAGFGEDGGSASHPSFASAPPQAAGYPYYSGYASHSNQGNPFSGMDQFSFDPFGFGIDGGFAFSDPFELFSRTFGSNFAMDVGNATGTTTAFGGGFPSVFDNIMGNGFPVASMATGMLNGNGGTTTTFSSSSYNFSGSGNNGSRMVSTTTTIVNGKAVTRREETVVNPDGTKTTTVDLTGDTNEQQQLIGNNGTGFKAGGLPRQLENSSRSEKACKKSNKNSPAKRLPKDRHSSRSRKASTHNNDRPKAKRCLRNGFETTTPSVAPSPAENPGSNYLVPELNETPASSKKTPSKFQDRKRVHHQTNQTPPKIPVIEILDDGEDVEVYNNGAFVGACGNNANPAVDTTSGSNNVQSATDTGNNMPSNGYAARRKRKFWEVMSRCLLCCFPIPKRRKTAISGERQ